MPMTVIFYAAMDDLTDLSRRLFEVPGIKLFEEYSAPDQPNLFFKSPDEISSYLSEGARSFAAWPSEVGGGLTRKNVAFSKEYREEEAEVSVPDGTVEFLADRIRSATGKKVTILYCPEWPRFRDPMSFEDDPDYGAALELEVAFKQNGIGFENMTSDLRKTFIEDQKLTRGFSNSFPGEGHLNENGHRLVARRVVSIITKPSR